MIGSEMSGRSHANELFSPLPDLMVTIRIFGDVLSQGGVFKDRS